MYIRKRNEVQVPEMTSIQSLRFKSHNIKTLGENPEKISHRHLIQFSETPFPSVCLWWTHVVSGCLASLPPPSSNRSAVCLENSFSSLHVGPEGLPIPVPSSTSHRDGLGPGPAGDLRMESRVAVKQNVAIVFSMDTKF